MNRKQLWSMWVGIVLVAGYGFLAVLMDESLPLPMFLNFVVWAFTVGIVSGGLMLTLRDRQEKAKEE